MHELTPPLSAEEQAFLEKSRRDFDRARASFRQFEEHAQQLGPEGVAQLMEEFERSLIERRRFTESVVREVEESERWHRALQALFQRDVSDKVH